MRRRRGYAEPMGRLCEYLRFHGYAVPRRLLARNRGSIEDIAEAMRDPDAEMYYYFGNWHGHVACFRRRLSMEHDCFVHYEVVDVADPCRWYRGCRYVYCGVVRRPDWARV